jgi:hypothetical protein
LSVMSACSRTPCMVVVQVQETYKLNMLMKSTLVHPLEFGLRCSEMQPGLYTLIIDMFPRLTYNSRNNLSSYV